MFFPLIFSPLLALLHHIFFLLSSSFESVPLSLTFFRPIILFSPTSSESLPSYLIFHHLHLSHLLNLLVLFFLCFAIHQSPFLFLHLIPSLLSLLYSSFSSDIIFFLPPPPPPLLSLSARSTPSSCF